MRVVTVHNRTRDTELARAEWRGSIVGRALGLMGRARLESGSGVVITPCNSVHMFFMRFPIDVAYIDRDRRVVKTVDTLRPYRLSLGGKGAHAAIELPAGTLAATGTLAGDELDIQEQGAEV